MMKTHTAAVSSVPVAEDDGIQQASRAADYMHGAIVPVDGGWLAR